MRDRHYPFEFLFAVFQIDGIKNRLALTIRQRQLDRRWIGRIDHHWRFHFSNQLLVERRNILLLVALGALQAHVYDVSSASHLPPVSTLFASFLGYNPIRNLLGPGILDKLPGRNVQVLTGKEFFPHLITGPFHHGLVIVFTAAIAMSVIAAAVSLLRGRQYYYDAAPSAGVAGRASAGAASAVFPASDAGATKERRQERGGGSAPSGPGEPASIVSDADAPGPPRL
jgi:hypothetical protein